MISKRVKALNDKATNTSTFKTKQVIHNFWKHSINHKNNSLKQLRGVFNWL